jgi:hypothetical protein
MPHRALETAVAPRAIAEREYVSHGALVMPDDDCRVEAEQYSIEARDDDSDVLHAVRGLPLDAVFVRLDACRTC